MKFVGSNPNIHHPKDKPKTLGIVYEASEDNSLWVWNGEIYVPQPHHGTPLYNVFTTKDIVSNGVESINIRELCITIPSGLKTVRAKYTLKFSSETPDASGVAFPKLKDSQLNSLTSMTFTTPKMPMLASAQGGGDVQTFTSDIPETEIFGAYSAFSSTGFFNTIEKTMVVDIVVTNSGAKTRSWPIQFVPNPSFEAPRTLLAGSNVAYTLHY